MSCGGRSTDLRFEGFRATPLFSPLSREPQISFRTNDDRLHSEEFADGFTGDVGDDELLDCSVALVSVIHECRARANRPAPLDFSKGPVGFPIRRVACIADRQFEVELEEDDSGWQVHIDSRPHRLNLTGSAFTLTVDFEFNNHSGSAQVSRSRHVYETVHGGSRLAVVMLEPHVAELARVMPKKISLIALI